MATHVNRMLGIDTDSDMLRAQRETQVTGSGSEEVQAGWHCTDCECKTYVNNDKRCVSCSGGRTIPTSAVAATVEQLLDFNNPYDEVIRQEAAAMLTRLEAERDGYRNRAHYAERAADLAMKHGDAAEKRNAKLEARLGEAVKVLDAILRAHNEGSGLIDCIDNAGERYTSRFLAETIETARAFLATLKEKQDADAR